MTEDLRRAIIEVSSNQATVTWLKSILRSEAWSFGTSLDIWIALLCNPDFSPVMLTVQQNTSVINPMSGFMRLLPIHQVMRFA